MDEFTVEDTGLTGLLILAGASVGCLAIGWFGRKFFVDNKKIEASVQLGVQKIVQEQGKHVPGPQQAQPQVTLVQKAAQA
ncbi:MAG: hypothetical protein DWB56_08000 [Candidatus Jettenia sp.]|uniref:Uncharacterized protein n=1 Tax=Candidatus Jettenia caeni TaxID=247490 RepID=I3IJD8_9BACT|nr:hypothetical protein [Candidatus Jettenia sp. AMX1]MBC6928888.1 hypothetical protein [Candidatus Jettenia sp.]GAB61833.1 hypothetical protein KSU1_C0237 [Candidatus Jettenia caeni]KAA0250868.1 MAG: hypothetical protein EDM77_03415 [Candidatus Jettenia sp. AMX1]MCE7879889.1 hypothetical protein [Candidatus Jettenia sp. AMX1]MCQ3926668.1 hypothetical protein [Candidatus Jettenia sp.]